MADSRMYASRKRESKVISTVGGWAALLVALLFFIPIVDLATASLRPGTPFENNFLVTIFKLHAGVEGVQVEALEVLSPLDITLMVLFAVVSLALHTALKRVNRVWAAVATALTPVGLVMYVLTEETGRSGIIAATLVFSILMLKSDQFSRRLAYLGLSASALLLIADAVQIFPWYTKLFAVIVSLGYALFVVWLSGLGRNLLRGDSG